MRKLVLIAAKVMVSVALLYFAVSRINLSTLGERLQQANLGWLLAAVLIALLQTGLVALRWQRIVAICGAALSSLQAFSFNLIGMFFNQVLPSNVGGDVVRIWLLARAGAGWSKATYSVLLDRFIGVLMLAVLVTGGLYWSFELIQNPIGRIALLIVGLGSLAAAAAFLALGQWRWLQNWKSTRHLAEIAALARKMLLSRDASAPIITLSLVIHFMTAAMAWSIARSVASPFEFVHGLLLVLPVMLIATAPISIAGWGVRESALVLAFSYAGLPESDGLIVSVLLGAVSFVIGLIGGLVWLLSGEQLDSSAAIPPADPSPS